MASTPATTPSDLAPATPGGAMRRHPLATKWLVLAAAVLCYVAFSWVGGRLGVARSHGFDGSLLLADGAAGNLLVTAVLVLAAVALGTLLAGTVRPDAGLFAAAVGLVALSNRGRPVYAVLHDADGRSGAYLLLGFELVLLYAMLGAGWWALHRLQESGRLHRDATRDGLADAALPAGAGWSALAQHVLATAAIVVVIAQTEDKKQVLAAVGIASFVAAFFPYWSPGVRPSVWYWAGPLVVGLAGYLFAFASAPDASLAVGRPGAHGGFLAALARPLPLDYASVGTAGALLGYWMRRKSVREREVMMATQAQAAA